MVNEDCAPMECPFCASYETVLLNLGEHAMVECLGCDASGPVKLDAHEAVFAWNYPTIRLHNSYDSYD